ncbi:MULTISPECIES: amino acid permease [Staphylococcus]|uniref:Alanine glycine permease n=1 Tax=Staphylococcus ureilyticus TaxID=94138 RepID=A0AB34AM15_STAUR|nr:MULTISPECIES: amino acid permease [Staphylococcus]AVL77564.1 amino acid permease [Staphylococcus cohnii]KKD21294.1 gamma-aminobutyrate permease [Staphylococcus cohnii subsp. cohnii]PIS62333.1 gamma-aminobutyrate permease [Corynebacterium striatum]KKD21908.1 gamma-aminobutyrate permease [Staphylococcus cohnii subsp. cohnii]MBL0377301.1 amino acid permease [Staphylococcus sp. S75]
MNENNELQRGLGARQMRMIALGGTIGVGLFMGATSTIKWTGPSVIFAYLIAGLFLFLVMRAMGEMVYLHPTSGSFANFASDYINPVAGYLTAWSNIFQWVVVGMSEVIAVGEYMNYWFPDLPQWIPGIIVVLLLAGANLVSVKAFGEFEFWFAMIKVVTIILMIIAGFGLIFFGLGNGGEAIGLSNLWSHGGFMPNGWIGFFFALSIVIGSYQGVELIGITAGETKDPQKNIKSAVNGVIWRILIFYIGAIFVIVTVYPWDELGNIGSPFVATFAKVGITFAAGLINFVVLTAAMSGCNSGIFSASRMTLNLSQKGMLPKFFRKVMKNGVPIWTVTAIAIGILVGALLNVILPLFIKGADSIFVYVYSASILPGMVPWFMILISHLRFRKNHSEELKNHPFKMPGGAITNYITMAFFIMVLIGMLFNKETVVSVVIGIVFLGFMTLFYYLKGYHKLSDDQQL